MPSEHVLTKNNLDILPRLKAWDSWLRRNCLETKRFDGLTIARQFVDAPTKYHFGSVNITVVNPSALRTHPRPIVQTEVYVFVAAVTQLA